MGDLIIGLFFGIGAGLLLAVVFILPRLFRGRSGKGMDITSHQSIESIRSVGELSVFKVVTKEIVTAKDYWAGEFGRKYLKWLASAKKMAMIFEFDIDFRYDLRDPGFKVLKEGEGKYRLKMPECTYEINIRDIVFYDEQKTRFLPWLLPDLLNSAFGGGFDEEDRNRLKEEAKDQAHSLAKGLVGKLWSEVRLSARQTMEALAKGFSVEEVLVDFSDTEPEEVKVRYKAAG